MRRPYWEAMSAIFCVIVDAVGEGNNVISNTITSLKHVCIDVKSIRRKNLFIMTLIRTSVSYVFILLCIILLILHTQLLYKSCYVKIDVLLGLYLGTYSLKPLLITSIHLIMYFVSADENLMSSLSIN